MQQSNGFFNVAIYPHQLNIYYEPFDRSRSYGSGYNSLKMPTDNKSAGLISRKAQKRINHAIDWMLAQSREKKYYSKKHKKHYKFRINFVTLTLSAPQIHSDNVIKSRLLNNFLVQLRKKWGVKYYLWRAE